MFPDDPTMLLMYPLVKVCCQEPSTLYWNITIILLHEESIWHLHRQPPCWSVVPWNVSASLPATSISVMACFTLEVQPPYQSLSASICPLTHDHLVTLIGHSTNVKLITNSQYDVFHTLPNPFVPTFISFIMSLSFSNHPYLLVNRLF